MHRPRRVGGLQSRLAPLLQNVSRIRAAAGATQVAIIGLAVGAAHPEPLQSRLVPLLRKAPRIRSRGNRGLRRSYRTCRASGLS